MAAETFTGPYAGVNFGYGAGHIEMKDSSAKTKTTHGMKGVIGGLHLGYQKDFGQFVAGLEASANLSNSESKNNYTDGRIVLKRRNAYGLAARLGMTLNTWLAYVKLGYENAKFDYRFNDTKDNKRLNAFVPGFGMETKLTPNVVFGGEWTYTMYSKKSFKKIDNDEKVKPSIGDFKLRLSYKF
jgi:opacity protein-like surface antigen